MRLRTLVNTKVLLLTAAVCAVTASTAVALSLSGDGTIVGSNAPDQLTAPQANDSVYGQGGADQITAGNGNDTLDGDGNCGTQAPGVYPNGVPGSPGCEDGQNQAGDANPGQQGSGPGDQITAGNGNDIIYGGSGLKNQITVGGGTDTIYGGPHDDQIATGTGGQATIWLGPGANTVSLGKVAKMGSSVVHAFISGDTAVDVITCSGGNATVYANSQDKVSKTCQKVVIGSGGFTDPLAARDLELLRAGRLHHKHHKRRSQTAHVRPGVR